MDSVTIAIACKKHQDIVNYYYRNNSKKLREMIDKILFKLKFNVENSDFYSLGNEIFLDALCRYNETQDFNGFLYSCLTNKFKTEMTRRNRKKRQADLLAISWNTPLKNDSETTIGDFISDNKKSDHYDIDKTFFEDNGEKYSEKMLKYINRLSNEQKEVVKMIIAGYEKDEIKKMLCMDEKKYLDCLLAIRSYRNISILF